MAPQRITMSKKMRYEPSRVKVMLIVAYDSESVIISHAIPQDQNVNAAYYQHFLEHNLHPAMQRKRPHFLRDNPPFIFLDNTRCHVAGGVAELLQRWDWTALEQPYIFFRASQFFILLRLLKLIKLGQRTHSPKRRWFQTPALTPVIRSFQNPSTSSHPEEVPDPANPTLDFAPSNKAPGEDGFFSATWPPFYLFPPGDTNKLIPPADMGRSGLYLGSPPSYAAYFDYALAEFVPGNADPEAVLVAASNAYRDTETGLDYVTLHIPPNAEDQGSSVSKADLLDVATKPEEKKSDDLERQDLPITGVALREPIVISQNERICVLMDTPSPAGDAREFTSL
ncbi:hypothetical protein ANN_21623 [Periplaneta americana]|uniref:DDE-1 domain-containing protein n=1 Tax=Periplaneta americana TaxID=6978 RepID=A0ABQ8S6E8_PERAM|nr:hypothetical protein ANN_21623 [Periplaneta americana]